LVFVNIGKKNEIAVKDRLGEIFIFTSKSYDHFYFKKTDYELTYLNFEKYIRLIAIDIKDVQSIEAYFLKQNIKFNKL
jgi:hypothetical protein